jgi:hypothetical protein
MIEKWVFASSGSRMAACTALLEALSAWFNEEQVRNAISSLNSNPEWTSMMSSLRQDLSDLSEQEKFADVSAYCICEFIKKYVTDVDAGHAITFDLVVPMASMLYHLGIIKVRDTEVH